MTRRQVREGVDWFLTHKTGLGSFVCAVAGVFAAFPGHHHGWDLALAIGTGLAGAGVAKSDSDQAARLRWENSGEERRVDDIPPRATQDRRGH